MLNQKTLKRNSKTKIRSFLDEHFLLQSSTAERLYYEFAKNQPIIDYHNHLDAATIAANKRTENIAELWLLGDPYKHRAMRLAGVPEILITGKTSPKEKFLHWAAVVPKTIGNPLFHWSCLELKYCFGINEILNASNAESIWQECNTIIRNTRRGDLDWLRFWNVESLCTSDEPLNSLASHQFVSKTGLRILPSFRGDALFLTDIRNGWYDHVYPVRTLDDYCNVIIDRIDAFDNAGCRLADHSLDNGFRFVSSGKEDAKRIFTQFKQGRMLQEDEIVLRSFLLRFVCNEYKKRNWTLQLHIGALRCTSDRLRRLSGFAGGYACMGNSVDMVSLCRLFNTLEGEDQLPNIILYTLNPSDNAVLSTLCGSFTEDGTAGKIRFGPAWWYNDFDDAIRRHLSDLAGYSLLSNFTGMTTDSRNVLSFSRHDYFRRILCDWFGERIERGEIPDDDELLAPLLESLCVGNARALLKNINIDDTPHT
ncbi:MAG: glucuronate isomerase [Planctomycetaceae bacterium]|jgi:glucuronate isomerase|nr:glucuronate isomerase [Planctomycetaceae bacterium]